MLGSLVEYRDQSVGDLITESVSHYLAHSNYNDTNEICKLLNNISIEVESLNATFPKLDALMQRRHQIVHRADRLETATSNNLATIEQTIIVDWINVVRDFADKVLMQVNQREVCRRKDLPMTQRLAGTPFGSWLLALPVRGQSQSK